MDNGNDSQNPPINSPLTTDSPNQTQTPIATPSTDSPTVQTFQPQQPSSVLTQNITPPQTTPPTIQSAYTPPEPEKANHTVLFIVLFFIIILIGAVIGGAWYYINTQKKEFSQIIDTQINLLTSIERDYAGVGKYLKDPTGKGTPAPSGSDKQLLQTQKPVRFGAKDVLGITTVQNTSDNTFIEYLSAISTKLDSLKRNNAKIKAFAKKTPQKYFLPDTLALTANTDTVINKTGLLINYLEESTLLGVDAVKAGYKLGVTVNDTIYRNADEASMKNFYRDLEEIKEVYDKYMNLNVSNLTPDIIKDHQSSVTSMKRDLEILDEIKIALEKKDGAALGKALDSLIMKGASDTVTSSVTMVSIWQSNDTIKSVSGIKNEWVEFRKDQLD